jgi:hypothetical protein
VTRHPSRRDALTFAAAASAAAGRNSDDVDVVPEPDCGQWDLLR